MCVYEGCRFCCRHFSSSEDDSEGEAGNQTNPSCMYTALLYSCPCDYSETSLIRSPGTKRFMVSIMRWPMNEINEMMWSFEEVMMWFF